MKKIILNILIVAILTTGVGGIFAVPKVAEASCIPGITSVIGSFRVTDCISDLGVIFILPTVGKLLQVSAYLFDKSLMLNMNISKFVSSSSTSTSPVEIIWKMIRDISGMFFIFVLVFSSIKMILTGDANKGIIVGIVLAGLTVNFSLFITKLLIDASNSASLTIYSAISPRSNILGNVSTEGDPENISAKIMGVVNLQTLFASVNKAGQEKNFNITTIIIVVGGASLMLVLAITFLAAAVMFLWRFILLLAIMAFSPFYALSFAFPQLKKQSDWFSKHLIDQCLFAPIFLFFLYVGMKILTNPDFIALSGSKGDSFAGVLTGVGIGPLIQYGLIIFVIFSGLGAASSYGAKGGEFGVEWIKGLGKWGQGAIKNAGVGIQRNTVGLAASKLAESNFINDRAGKGFAGKMVLQGLKGAAKNYNEIVDKKAKSDIDFGNSLGFDKGKVYQVEKMIKNEIDENIQREDKLAKLELELKSQANASQRAMIEHEIKLNKAYTKASKESIRISEGGIREIKNSRKGVYAKTLDPREIDPKTGKPKALSILSRLKKTGFVSSAEEQAGATLSIPGVEDEIKIAKERLDDAKKSRDKIKDDITRLQKEKKERGDLWWQNNPGKQTSLDEATDKLTAAITDEVLPAEQELKDSEFKLKQLKNLT